MSFDQIRATLDAEENALQLTETTEDALALEYARQYSDRLRYCAGRGWMHLDGNVWRTDDRLRYFTYARSLLRSAAQLEPKQAKSITAARTVNAIVSLARSDERLIVTPDIWDSDRGLLNTPSGIIDLATGSSRRMTAGDHVSKSTAVAPSRMQTPVWQRFLSEVFCGDAEVIEFMRLLLGYCLTGYTREQKLFFFKGSGANGKSTLLDIVEWIIGDYSLKLPAEALMQSRHPRHPTELAQLVGVRLATSSEIEDSQYWAEARIKELTGDETLTARFMHRDFFTFRQTQKHVVCGNYRPRLKGGDSAMQRRMVLVPFDAKFEGGNRDNDLPNKLRAEAPGILAWMIEGAIDWHTRGLLIPERIQAASAEYMQEMDDIATWLDECCELGFDQQEQSSLLYRSFSDWKRDRNERPPSLNSWRERLLQGHPTIEAKRTKGSRLLVGVSLNVAEKHRVETGG